MTQSSQAVTVYSGRPDRRPVRRRSVPRRLGLALLLCLVAAMTPTQPSIADQASPSGPTSRSSPASPATRPATSDRQVTFAPHGHVLTNANVWSPDGRRVVYDVRSDAEGAAFDGTRIETVDVDAGDVRVLYESRRGACCGVATYHPREPRVVFILGPENPTPDWTYGPARRQGVTVDEGRPGVATPLDASDLTPPFTPGALRGGSHVHVFSPDGALVSFTYDDHVLSRFAEPGDGHDVNQRNVGVCVVDRPVAVPKAHGRNHDGSGFAVLVTRTAGRPPRAGSDEYGRACEEAWVGTAGYVRADGTRRRRALAFQGTVATPAGEAINEVFVADLPDDLTRPGPGGPLAGTVDRLPYPPGGVTVRRLTRTADRRHPGIQGPRHWLRSSPDGSRIAFLMRDEAGDAQLWTVSPTGGEPTQVTRNPFGVASAFTWSPDGRHVAHAMDNSVCVTDAATGATRRLTPRAADADAPLPLACVFSPDGGRVAYLRRVRHEADGRWYNQVFVVTVP
jgi:hypothetical protein